MAIRRSSRLTPNEQRLRRNALDRIRRRERQGAKAGRPVAGKQGAFDPPKKKIPDFQTLPARDTILGLLKVSMRNAVVISISYRRVTPLPERGRSAVVTRRDCEPYSFRRGPSGLAVMCFDQKKRMIRRFIVNSISALFPQVKADGTIKTFKPRWPIEI